MYARFVVASSKCSRKTAPMHFTAHRCPSSLTPGVTDSVKLNTEWVTPGITKDDRAGRSTKSRVIKMSENTGRLLVFE